jgi:hypothetical protein
MWRQSAYQHSFARTGIPVNESPCPYSVCVRMFVCVFMHVRTYACVYGGHDEHHAHTDTHVCMQRMCVCVLYIYAHTHAQKNIHTHTHTHTHTEHKHTQHAQAQAYRSYTNIHLSILDIIAHASSTVVEELSWTFDTYINRQLHQTVLGNAPAERLWGKFHTYIHICTYMLPCEQHHRTGAFVDTPYIHTYIHTHVLPC